MRRHILLFALCASLALFSDVVTGAHICSDKDSKTGRYANTPDACSKRESKRHFLGFLRSTCKLCDGTDYDKRVKPQENHEGNRCVAHKSNCGPYPYRKVLLTGPSDDYRFNIMQVALHASYEPRPPQWDVTGVSENSVDYVDVLNHGRQFMLITKGEKDVITKNFAAEFDAVVIVEPTTTSSDNDTPLVATLKDQFKGKEVSVCKIDWTLPQNGNGDMTFSEQHVIIEAWNKCLRPLPNHIFTIPFLYHSPTQEKQLFLELHLKHKQTLVKKGLLSRKEFDEWRVKKGLLTQKKFDERHQLREREKNPSQEVLAA